MYQSKRRFVPLVMQAEKVVNTQGGKQTQIVQLVMQAKNGCQHTDMYQSKSRTAGDASQKVVNTQVGKQQAWTVRTAGDACQRLASLRQVSNSNAKQRSYRW
jgi:hypothetical protein